MFLEALNNYFHDKLESNNITIEVNCAFQKNDLFEPVEIKHAVNALGNVEEIEPRLIEHNEGDILNVLFVDARQIERCVKGFTKLSYVETVLIVCLLEEEGVNNSKRQFFPGLKNFVEARQSASPVFFMKCDAEMKGLYELGSKLGPFSQENGLPKQVLVGKRGQIVYIGPAVSENKLQHLIS